MKNLIYIVTNKCNISCDFCAPECSPDCQDYLSAHSMIKIYNDLKESVKLIVFTGGEPMLYKKEILETILSIKSRQPNINIRIVTNGYWAKSISSAKATIKELHSAGLTEINFSVDDFHQKFISLETIKNGINAAHELNIPVLLAHKTYPNSVSDKKYYEGYFNCEITDLKDFNENADSLLFFTSAYTLPLGRGSEKIDINEWVIDENKNRWSKPCSSILNSYVINADGYLSAGCGLFDNNNRIFYAENVLQENISDVYAQYSNSVIYNWIALEGPNSIKEFVKKIDSSITFKEKYVQHCEICQELFSNEKVIQLLNNYIEKIAERVFLKRYIFETRRLEKNMC